MRACKRVGLGCTPKPIIDAAIFVSVGRCSDIWFERHLFSKDRGVRVCVPRVCADQDYIRVPLYDHFVLLAHSSEFSVDSFSWFSPHVQNINLSPHVCKT